MPISTIKITICTTNGIFYFTGDTKLPIHSRLPLIIYLFLLLSKNLTIFFLKSSSSNNTLIFLGRRELLNCIICNLPLKIFDRIQSVNAYHLGSFFLETRRDSPFSSLFLSIRAETGQIRFSSYLTSLFLLLTNTGAFKLLIVYLSLTLGPQTCGYSSC